MGHFEAEAVTDGGGDGTISAWNSAAIGSTMTLIFVCGGVGSRPGRCEPEVWEPSLLLSPIFVMEANGQPRFPATPELVKSCSIGLE